MSAIKAVSRAMERIAPLRLAEKWDNVGLLLESPVQRPKANRVLLTIDLTPSVLTESLETGTSVIVSYHPPLFRPLSSITLSNPLQTTLLRCAAEGISVFAPHTSLDNVWGGINDWLADGVLNGGNNGKTSALIAEKLSPTGESEGAEGRLVTLREPIEMKELERRVKKHLGISLLQVGYADDSRIISTVAICAGSGGSMLVGQKADVYFTGEMQHHDILASIASGKHVILCGHTNTERGYLPTLALKLQEELKVEDLPLEVIVSKNDKHPLQIV